MDIAASIQQVTEEIMLRMARHVHSRTGMKKLCLAGGVALNCVGNGRILREGPFDELWVQPAAGDAGGALGVALALWHRYLGRPRLSAERAGTYVSASRVVTGAVPVGTGGGARLNPMTAAGQGNGAPPYHDEMHGAFLGPAYSGEEIGAWLARRGYPGRRLDRAALAGIVAQELASGRVVGLLQGRMEFGPRALGGRSILGDPRSPAMQSLMNLKIKFRESFRPFAPAVLREHAAEWFALEVESPYMLLVADVAEHRRLPVPDEEHARWGIERLKSVRSQIPAVTHVDHSARIQTVRPEPHGLFHGILAEFHELTGCPVLVNTSFNVRGEPIVCTPEDAYRCFMRTEMDLLVLETFLLQKADQPPLHEPDWRQRLARD
jgi:carbamoyltransferase